jgi:hypothetical protein
VQTQPPLALDARVRRRLPHFSDTRNSLSRAEAPLLGRAWAFQERILAPRVLHFGPHELLWECRERSSCECGIESGEMGNLPRMRMREAAACQSSWSTTATMGKALEVWFLLMSSYAKLALTYEHDREMAIRGVALSFEELIHSRYVAGIWEECLHTSLQWYVDRTQVKIPKGRVKSDWPTWSWLSACSSEGEPIEMIYGYTRPLSSLEIKPLDRIPLAGNLSDARSSWVIKASGCITPVTVKLLNGVIHAIKPVDSILQDHWFRDGLSHADYSFRASGPSMITPGMDLYCLPIATDGTKVVHLVLRCLDHSLEIYERVGLQLAMFEGTKNPVNKEITIV